MLSFASFFLRLFKFCPLGLPKALLLLSHMHVHTRSEMSGTDHWNASAITAPTTKLNCCNFRKGRTEEPGNYRSVSLTSVPRMIVEKILLGDISKHPRDTKMTEHSWCNVALPWTNLQGEDWLSRGGRAAHPVYLDFRETFNTVSHRTLTVKLVKYGVGKCTTRWMNNRLGCGVQRVLISSAKSTKKVAGF